MSFQCNKCGFEMVRWEGKCPSCGSWGTVEEIADVEPLGYSADRERAINSAPSAETYSIKDIQAKRKGSKASKYERYKSGIEEFDRVLGGGLVPGSVVMLSGDPGVGKSTLLLQLLANLARSGVASCYASGEESVEQVVSRLERISGVEKLTGKLGTLLQFTSERRLESVIKYIGDSGVRVLVVDSLQVFESISVTGLPGSLSQVRAVGQILVKFAKELGVAVLLVGQVNKEGMIAGPKVVEHLVDVVLYLEGDRQNYFRLLRPLKNRFGSIDEVGVFELLGSGMVGVSNPSLYFVEKGDLVVPGSAVGALIKGSRVIFVEVQALVVEREYAPGPLRRVVNGFKKARLEMLVALLSKRLGLKLLDKDIFVNVAGGVSGDSPSVDLAVCAALMSAVGDFKLPAESVFLGELSLSGSVKPFWGQDRLVKECGRLGYRNVYLAKAEGANRASKGVVLHLLSDIGFLKKLR